jgi:tetraprenyl-beta-curcumene synthase
LETISRKRGNLDGAAAFAAFVPYTHRRAVVRSLLAFQAAYDFADTLSEQPSDDPVANARLLHEALLVSLSPTMAHPDYYARSQLNEDGGYLEELVDVCREAVATLPCYRLVSAPVWRAATRIVSYQALNAPCPDGSYEAYARWASSETPPESDLRWWETGASAGSSLAIFALIAAAGNPLLASEEVAAIERAYWPWIGALHTLLDSMVDQAEDLTSGQQSLISYYGSSSAAATGMRRLAAHSVGLASELRSSSQHLILLTAMSSLYLCSPEAQTPQALAVSTGVLDTLGDLAKPTMMVMGARRVLGRLTESL